MPRTSAEDVKAVLAPGKDYDTDAAPDLGPFIETASALVDGIVACAAECEETVSAVKAELLERWLAAWAYCNSDLPEQSHSEGGASASFQGQTGMGLESNYYGQTALRLDTTGCLAAITSGQRPSVDWGGKRYSEEIPYYDRD